MNVPDPLPLRSIPVPLEVSQVEGCDCGGLDWHRASSSFSPLPACTIWDLPPAEREAAIAAAKARLTDFTDQLNARLRAALGRLP